MRKFHCNSILGRVLHDIKRTNDYGYVEQTARHGACGTGYVEYDSVPYDRASILGYLSIEEGLVTSRERVAKALAFETVDRVPLELEPGAQGFNSDVGYPPYTLT